MPVSRVSNSVGSNSEEFEAAGDAEAIDMFARLCLYRRDFLGWVPVAHAKPEPTGSAHIDRS